MLNILFFDYEAHFFIIIIIFFFSWVKTAVK